MNSSYLYQFFKSLQNAGFAIGVSEYKLLLKAVRLGYSFSNKNELLALCKMLWLKSERDSIDFEYQFQISFSTLRYNLVVTNEERKSNESEEGKKEDQGNNRRNKKDQEVNKSKEDTIEVQEGDEIEEKAFAAAPEDETLNMQMTNQKFENKRNQIDTHSNVKYQVRRDYLPITHRKLLSVWKKQYKANASFGEVELNIDRTIKEIYEKGFFIKPFFKKSKISDRLFIFLDVTGSMIAFSSLAERIYDTASRNANRRYVEKFYFRNLPNDGKVYKDLKLTEPVDVNYLLTQSLGNKDAALIVSDAGAARGNKNGSRINETLQFVKKIRQSIEIIVWINPMPRRRWRRNSAGEIAKYVQMFSAADLEIEKAVRILQKY